MSRWRSFPRIRSSVRSLNSLQVAQIQHRWQCPYHYQQLNWVHYRLSWRQKLRTQLGHREEFWNSSYQNQRNRRQDHSRRSHSHLQIRCEILEDVQTRHPYRHDWNAKARSQRGWRTCVYPTSHVREDQVICFTCNSVRWETGIRGHYFRTRESKHH